MKLLFVLLLLLSSSLSHAIGGPIDFMKGRWEGKAVKGNTQLKAVECVSSKEGAAISTIEASYTTLDDKPANYVFGVVSPLDRAAGKYRFHLFLADGSSREAQAEIDVPGQRGTWGFEIAPPRPEAPTTYIRYIFSVTGNEFSERGELSYDNVKWTQFFESSMTRTAGHCVGL